MTIVVRNDKASGITSVGIAAKLVSLSVIKAYEKCKEFDYPSLAQWEANAWAKITLKVHSDKEIREIAAKAEAEGISHYLLEREVTLWRKCKGGDTEESKKDEVVVGENQETKKEEPKGDN